MTIMVENRISEIERVGRLFGGFWAEHGLPPDLKNDVNLALEEVLGNVILHAYRDEGEHQFQVRLSLENREVKVEIEDDGAAFNPLEAPEPDISGPLRDRPIGGLGIHLVRRLMDRLEYRREAGRNHLLLRKRLPSS